jgi:CheY-like chemotaxis protein
MPEPRERRILVVDDNCDAADTLGMLLETLGATVEVARRPDGARRARAFRADTVLLDIGMPEIDGYEVARRIRLPPRHEHVTPVALTGWGQDQDYRLSQTAGFDHHLVKPGDELRAVLAQHGREGQHATQGPTPVRLPPSKGSLPPARTGV